MNPLTEKVEAPVPPLVTLKVEVLVTGLVPPPTTTSPLVMEVAPVPPLVTLKVEVEVTALAPPPTRSSPELRAVKVKLPLIRRVESKVEEALTNIPAEEEVGVKALVKSVSQAPGVPPLSSLVQITLPEASVEREPEFVKVVQFRWASLKFEVTSNPAEAVVVAAWSFKVLAADRYKTVSLPITIPVEEATAPVCWATPPTYNESVVVAEFTLIPVDHWGSEPDEVKTVLAPPIVRLEKGEVPLP